MEIEKGTTEISDKKKVSEKTPTNGGTSLLDNQFAAFINVARRIQSNFVLFDIVEFPRFPSLSMSQRGAGMAKSRRRAGGGVLLIIHVDNKIIIIKPLEYLAE